MGCYQLQTVSRALASPATADPYSPFRPGERRDGAMATVSLKDVGGVLGGVLGGMCGVWARETPPAKALSCKALRHVWRLWRLFLTLVA